MIRKIILIIGILFAIIFLIVFFNTDYVKLYRKGSYKFISEATAGDMEYSSSESVYYGIKYVKKIKGEEELNQLLTSFISPTNENCLTQGAAIQYILQNKKVEYLDELKILQKHIEHINQLKPDSVWTVSLRPQYLKECSFNDYYVEYLNEVIKKLEKSK